jgi:hypothetical protein
MTTSCMQGEMMDPVGGLNFSNYDRHVLTDLTLALAQDSGWCVHYAPFVSLSFSPWRCFGVCAGCYKSCHNGSHCTAASCGPMDVVVSAFNTIEQRASSRCRMPHAYAHATVCSRMLEIQPRVLTQEALHLFAPRVHGVSSRRTCGKRSSECVQV